MMNLPPVLLIRNRQLWHHRAVPLRGGRSDLGTTLVLMGLDIIDEGLSSSSIESGIATAQVMIDGEA